MVAIGAIYLPKSTIFASKPHRPLTISDANANIGFNVTNALNEANRKAHAANELTQDQKNQLLMDAFGERSSLADMERAVAGVEAKVSSQKNRNQILEEAYGDKTSIKDLERAMELYEVQ
jgi:SHS2 domain-containing protein